MPLEQAKLWCYWKPRTSRPELVCIQYDTRKGIFTHHSAGRNGGHIAPASFAVLPALTTALADGGAGLDDDSALHVLDNEVDTLAYAAELVAFEDLDVDFWRGKKLDGGSARQSLNES